MGILLYVLITGYWPYSGPTQEATKSCVQNGDTTLAYDLLPPDDDLLNLLQRMLSKNPDERPGITDVLANRWLLQDLDNSFISFRNSGGKENNLRDQLVAEPSQTLSKSSSEPDMVDMQSSLVIKSPRRHRSSVKYDNEADLNVSSLSDSTRGIENPPQKSKSRRKRFRTVFALFSKLKR
jgi:serine/threonine protein kinase